MNDDRQPTPDERAGMDWWNGLSEGERLEWLLRSRGDRAVDAWEAYKRAAQQGDAS
ncbi:hypothetical protein [Burkholderia latens]|uniref:hypothetical protein n=1 Tax=Burkholderia latens TaxID=488446 RepID=UPI0039A6B8F5